MLIEAKVVEVTLSDAYQTGVDWSQIGFTLTGKTGSMTLGFPFKARGISATLTALEQQGNINVLSNPRISVMNNEPAIINVGNDNFFVTDVTFGTIDVGGNATQTASSVDLTPFFSGLSLKVIPRVDSKDEIELYTLELQEVQKAELDVGLSTEQQLKLPTASIKSRETDSSVKASNEVIVLGGMISTKSTSTDKSLPLFRRIGLDTNKEHSNSISELVILLRAKLVDNNTWLSIDSFNDYYDEITNINPNSIDVNWQRRDTMKNKYFKLDKTLFPVTPVVSSYCSMQQSENAINKY